MAVFFTILIICQFGSGTEYYTDGPAGTYDGHFYSEGVLNSIEGLNIGFSIYGDFMASGFTLKFHDTAFDIRSRDENDLHNSIISIYLYDGTTATKITDSYVSKIGRSNKYAILKCSTENLSFSKKFLYTIDRSEFPDCPDDVLGQTINYILAESSDSRGGEPKIGKAWRVDLSSTKDYIYGKLPTHGDAASTFLGYIDKVFDNGVDITSKCAFVFDTITIEGIEYKRAFINLIPPGSTYDYLGFTSYNDLQSFEIVMDKLVRMYPDLSLDSSNISDLKDFMEKRYLWAYDSSIPIDYIYFGTLLRTNITGIELLKGFCNSFLINYRIQNNQLIFTWIDYSMIDGSETGTFDQTVMEVNGYETDTDWIVNKITANFQPDGTGGTLRKADFAFYDNIANRATNDVKQEEIILPFVPYLDLPSGSGDVFARNTSKHYLILHKEAISRIQARGNLINTGILYPGDYIRLRHPDLKTPNAFRHYLVEKVNCTLDSGSYEINLDLIDVEYLKNIDYNCRLNIHSWINGSTEFHSDAPGFDCYLQSFNSIEHTTFAGSLGGCMAAGNGINKYFRTASGSASELHRDQFDILQYTNYTVFVEFAMNTYVSNQWLALCYENSNNQWYIRQRGSDSKIQFRLYESGILRLSLVSTTAITDANAHQVVIIKVGDEYGLYLDGNLEAYNTGSYSYSIKGYMRFLLDDTLSVYTDGNVGEIYLGASNVFNASPDVGLTDTIAVKVNPFNWYGLNE